MRQRLRYHFDNLMARGVGAQILLLAFATLVLIALVVGALFILGFVPADDQGVHDSLGKTVWKALNHTLDPGNLGGDSGGWGFLIVMLFATIGGLFVVSALIGVLNQGFVGLVDSLRRGKSAVIETGHTVILGWGPKIATLLRELAEANQNVRGACVVILADRDKVEMDVEIAAAMKGRRMRVVTRSGSVMAMEDLALLGLASSKSVIVLAPETHDDGTPMLGHESDTIVLKSLLAIAKVAPNEALHIVAEIFDERTAPVARLVAGDKAALILAAPLISRLLVQTGRQSGLSVVYSELLDFEGVEIYLSAATPVLGKTFRDAVFVYDTSTLIGVFTAAGEMHIAPLERVFVEGDQVVVISEDDDTILANGTSEIDKAQIVADAPEHAHVADRTLVLGASPRLPVVLRELDSYAAPGSAAVVYGEELTAMKLAPFENLTVQFHAGDITSRGVLDALDITSFDHVLVLSETEGRTQEMADARTTVTLLYLRDIERKTDKKIPITSEILQIQNRDLATVAEADDFIVSNALVSLMVSQVSENPHLVEVFDELFTAGGYELYLKPVERYVRSGEVSFATVCEAALHRDEIAIGYRLVDKAKDAGFGVVVNPNKRTKVTLGAGDKIIVLAED